MDEGNTIDPFDDLFEAFELEDGPPPPGDEPREPRAEAAAEVEPAETAAPTATVVCTSCGTGNPAHNRHCEQCGARLGTGPLPVAPAPMIRATPGGRALTVLGGVLLVVLVAVFLWQLGDDEATPTSTTLATPSTTLPNVVKLEPFEVVASSSFPGFEADHLIDNDETSYWNDNSLRGNNAWLEFSFAQPVQITEIELQNLDDEEKLRRNYRIKSMVITVDDLQFEFPMTLADNNEPQRLQIGSLETRKVRLEVRSTYPAEQYDGDPPFDELALQSVLFFGTRASS